MGSLGAHFVQFSSAFATFLFLEVMFALIFEVFLKFPHLLKS